MPGPMPSPPPIRGVSQTSEDESPFDAMLRTMQAKPQPAMSLIHEAVDSLKRAARLDPKVAPLVERMLRPMNQSMDDEDEEDTGEPPRLRRPGDDRMVENRESGPSDKDD